MGGFFGEGMLINVFLEYNYNSAGEQIQRALKHPDIYFPSILKHALIVIQFSKVIFNRNLHKNSDCV